MKILAWILVVWLACLAIGVGFGILGKIIWLAVLVTIIGGLYKYIQDNKSS